MAIVLVSISELSGAGLNLAEVDLFMIFPEWAKGLGAVYRVDNVFIGIPEGDENPYTDSPLVIGGDDGSGDTDTGETQEPGVELIQNSDFGNTVGWGLYRHHR